MKDKYLYLILGALIVGNVIVGYDNVRASRISNEVLTKSEVMEIRNVLPVNENKKVASKEEIRLYIREEARKAGLDVDLVEHIARCESGFNEKARSRTGKYLGLWQISRIHGVSDECRLDGLCSTKWAIKKIKRDGNMNAWECASL